MQSITSCRAVRGAQTLAAAPARRQSVRAPVRVMAYVEDKESTPPKTAGNGGKVGSPPGRPVPRRRRRQVEARW